MALQVGQVLESRYRIVSKGTAQDIGTAYKAYDMQLDRLAVVLLLDRRFETDASILDRLGQVNQAVADLVQLDLVPYEHVGVVDGRPWLARSHVEGESLAEVLERAGALDVDAAVDIAVRLCEALTPAHREGLVHGGLSSHSVLVGDGGRITVIDAGLMLALRPVPAPPGQPWGRFPYLSPEQAAGEDASPASDVYVLGMLLYEVLAGHPPFHSDDLTNLALQHLRQDPVPLQTLVPHVPMPLVQIVHKALSKEPAARYRNAGQLAHILRSQVGLQPAAPMPESAIHRPRALAGEQQSFPPSPAPPSMARPVEEFYRPGTRADAWAQEPAGVDWLMIGLIVAALIAVLGLIPLWRTVYRRYALPESITTPASYHLPDGKANEGANASAGLDDLHLVWYNPLASDRNWTETGFSMGVRAGLVAAGGEIPGLGVQITVLGASCITL